MSRFSLLNTSTCFFLVLAAFPLQGAPEQAPGGVRTPQFEATTELVIVDVTVRGRDGKPVEGLKKEDFAVSEDGKPQVISIFESQRLSLDSLPAPPPVPAAPADQAAARREITAFVPSQRYQDHRLIVLFFDLTSMQPQDQMRAQDAALKFLREKMTASDLVAVMTFSSRLQVVEDFTNDRDELARIIRGFRPGELSSLAGLADENNTDTDTDTGAAFYADETEFNIFNTDRKLAALETAVRLLARLPEKKALVYFSSGVGKTGVENLSQLQSTVNAAVRANVSFYPVDARGLVALVPGNGDASHAAPRGTGLYSGTSHAAQKNAFNDSQETLVTLAGDTGGKAFLDSNDLATGIAQAQQDIRAYYILGYYSTNPARDGRFRRIRVSLNGDKEAKLDYRSGYFAGKEFRKFTESDKEQQLQEALMLGNPVTDLPLALEVDYFRLAPNTYFVPVAVKIPGSEVSLARHGGKDATEFDFIGEVRDSKGKLMSSVRDGIQVKLDRANGSQLGQRHLQYDTGFTLPPGRYRIKFLARENQTGKMGTFEAPFEIPDLSRQAASLRLSSIVWSNQREPLDAAVGSAEKRKKLLASDPLVQEGQRLIPSITRVFRKGQNLYVYAELYDPAVAPSGRSPSVAASLSFFQGKTKAFESTPVHLTQTLPSRRSTLPLQFQVPLAPLKAGQYTCQLNIIDEVGRKFSFPRASLVLLP